MLLRDNEKNKGAFPRDDIPAIKERPAALIVNTDSKDETGEHWVAILLLEDTGEYFDSLGLPPLYPQLFEYLTAIGSQGFIYNLTTIQHPQAISCAELIVLSTSSGRYLENRIKTSS